MARSPAPAPSTAYETRPRRSGTCGTPDEIACNPHACAPTMAPFLRAGHLAVAHAGTGPCQGSPGRHDAAACPRQLRPGTHLSHVLGEGGPPQKMQKMAARRGRLQGRAHGRSCGNLSEHEDLRHRATTPSGPRGLWRPRRVRAAGSPPDVKTLVGDTQKMPARGDMPGLWATTGTTL